MKEIVLDLKNGYSLQRDENNRLHAFQPDWNDLPLRYHNGTVAFDDADRVEKWVKWEWLKEIVRARREGKPYKNDNYERADPEKLPTTQGPFNTEAEAKRLCEGFDLALSAVHFTGPAPEVGEPHVVPHTGQWFVPVWLLP